MDQESYKQIELDNNLTVSFYDCSKRIAGDRFLVRLVIKVVIPVSGSFGYDKCNNCADIAEIQKILGKSVVFQQVKERNFIDQKEKEKVLEELYLSFINNALIYLRHPDFKKNFVLKCFKEKLERSGWYNQP